MLAGGVSWATGNMIWIYYQTCQHWPLVGCKHSLLLPYPSVADLFYCATYPLLAAAAMQMGTVLGARRRHWWGYAIISLCLGIPIFYIGLPRMHVLGIRTGLAFWIPQTANSTTIWTTSVYMSGDVVVLSMAVVLLTQARKVAGGMFFGPLSLFVASIATLCVADAVFFREVAENIYIGAGFAAVAYAAVLMLLPYTVHRFTLLPRRLEKSSHGSVRNVCHEAADAILAAQLRMLGPLALEIAEGASGVLLRDHELHLSLPHEQSLLALANEYGERTGHFGRRLSLQAVREVADARTGHDLDGVADDLARAIESDHASSYQERTLVIAAWAGALWLVAVVAENGGNLKGLAHRLLLDIAPALLLIAVFGGAVLRSRRSLEERSRQLQRSNESLATLLGGFDDAHSTERKRIAGEIHDFALQQLVGASMHIERAQQNTTTDPQKAAAALDRTADLMKESIGELRRIMEGLEPSSLFHRQLPAALAELGSKVHAAYGVRVEINANELPELELSQQLLIFRMISECVTNAGKHSAGTKVSVQAHKQGNDLQILVVDDGRGFASPIELVDEMPPTQGWGLRLLFEHVLQDGGHFSLRSAPGKGASIELLLPLRTAAS